MIDTSYSSIAELEKNLKQTSTSPISIWKPNFNQVNLLERPEREVLGGGNRGGGKTEGVLAALARYHEHPKYTALVIRKKADDLKSWAKRAKEFFAPIGGKVVDRPPQVHFPAGGRIYTGHLNDPDAYTKYVGQEYWIINIEELTQIHSEHTYEQLLGSCRCPIKEINAQMICTTNPGGAGHVWVKNRFVDKCREEYEDPETGEIRVRYKTYIDPETGSSRIFVPMPLHKNEYIYENDKQYVNYLKGISDPNLKKAWLYGDWEVFMGQFFSMWNPDIHVVKRKNEIPKTWKLYRGIDYAHRNPTSCLWGGVDRDGNITIYREFLESNLSSGEAATKIRIMSRDETYVKTVADPSMFPSQGDGVGKRLEKRTRRGDCDYFADEGVYLVKANNDRPNGWHNIKHLLSTRKLFISDSCYNLIEHIPYATYHKTKTDDIEQPVVKSGQETFYHWDDLDSLRYLCMHIMGYAPSPKKESEYPAISVKPFFDSLFKPAKGKIPSWLNMN